MKAFDPNNPPPDPNAPVPAGYFSDKETALNTARTLDGKGIWCEVVPDGRGFALVSRGRTLGLLMQPILKKHGANGNGHHRH